MFSVFDKLINIEGPKHYYYVWRILIPSTYRSSNLCLDPFFIPRVIVFKPVVHKSSDGSLLNWFRSP